MHQGEEDEAVEEAAEMEDAKRISMRSTLVVGEGMAEALDVGVGETKRHPQCQTLARRAGASIPCTSPVWAMLIQALVGRLYQAIIL